MLQNHNDNYVFQIIKKALIFVLILIGLMFLSFKEPKFYVLGFIFGASINILCFLLLNITLKKAVQMEPSKAYGYATANYFIRYFIYFIVLTISIIADYLSFITTVLGMFTIKIVILSKAFYDTIKRRINKKNNNK